jgi:hypothetical protein
MRVGTVQTFGTRIEVKRNEAIVSSATAEIAFVAVVAAPRAHAA